MRSRLPSTRFDPERPEWLSKTHFLMLMRDEKLAELTTRFDAEAGQLTIERHGRTVLRESLRPSADGRRRVEAFFDEFLAGGVGRAAAHRRGGGARLCRCPPQAERDDRPIRVADQSRKHRARSNSRSARRSTPLRFRANVYFEGAPAWSELEWLEHGDRDRRARLRVVSAITRCAATQVNPATAKRDLDIVGGAARGFGHNLMGVYAEVVEGGEIAAGDAIMLRAALKERRPPAGMPA